MASFESNPFTVLSLIAAPAVLTNASSVLALGTGNRFARAVDRARALSAEIGSGTLEPEFEEARMRQLDRSEKRSILLARAMASFYLGVGCFASASLVSLFGAGVNVEGFRFVSRLFQFGAVLVGIVGVSGIVHGCWLLLHEVRLVILNLQEEGELVRAKRAERLKSTDASCG